MASLGMAVNVDAAGNLRGFHASAKGSERRLLIGSHLDTVPNAGAYDGVLGVVLGIALVESLRQGQLPFGIEIIGFSDEEGIRFGTPFLGSRALAGKIDDELLAKTDANGISIAEAIHNFSLLASRLPEAEIGSDAFAYLEFHIEQGPVLDALNQPLAVVESIVGQSRWSVTFQGEANHAGTTPMHLRKDALAGAAEWIEAVEQQARRVQGLVATVGSVEALPGAINVIAGTAVTSLDIRHPSDKVRRTAGTRMLQTAERIARRRKLTAHSRPLLDQPAVSMDAGLVEVAADAIRKAGCTPFRMPSGAGHDAMIMVEKVPSVMIFLRSPRGISHHPEETVLAEDVELALAAGEHLLRQVAIK